MMIDGLWMELYPDNDGDLWGFHPVTKEVIYVRC